MRNGLSPGAFAFGLEIASGIGRPSSLSNNPEVGRVGVPLSYMFILSCSNSSLVYWSPMDDASSGVGPLWGWVVFIFLNTGTSFFSDDLCCGVMLDPEATFDLKTGTIFPEELATLLTDGLGKGCSCTSCLFVLLVKLLVGTDVVVVLKFRQSFMLLMS